MVLLDAMSEGVFDSQTGMFQRALDKSNTIMGRNADQYDIGEGGIISSTTKDLYKIKPGIKRSDTVGSYEGHMSQFTDKTLTQIVTSICDKLRKAIWPSKPQSEVLIDRAVDAFGLGGDDYNPAEGKMLACRRGIPILLLALADYCQEGFSISVHLDLLRPIMDLLYKLCIDMNICKAMCFKGDGAFHLTNLINRNCSLAIVFMDRLTSENNIGAYVSKNFFDALSTYYTRMVDSVVAGCNNDTDPKNFDYLKY
jgi:hypothetical protein